MARTFEEIKDAIKNDTTLPFKIITEGDTYITIEDEEGYRASMQVETMGFSRKMEYATALSFATVHKPNRKSGSGYKGREISPNASISLIVETLKVTLEDSKSRILSGREKMDTRKPHENGKYLI